MNQSSQGNACCPLPAECVNCLGTWLAILTFRDNKSKNCACCWLGCSQVSKIITASNQKQTKQLHALSLTSSMCSCMDARALYPCQMPLPASCTSLRLIHGLLRFHTAQTRRADRQALLLLILLLIPRGEGGLVTVPIQSRWNGVGFLHSSIRDAHLDRRVSRGQLRVKALHCTSSCHPAPAEEINTSSEDSLAVFFFFFFLIQWQAQSAFWRRRGKTS